jgi:hypothetical protein
MGRIFSRLTDPVRGRRRRLSTATFRSVATGVIDPFVRHCCSASAMLAMSAAGVLASSPCWSASSAARGAISLPVIGYL